MLCEGANGPGATGHYTDDNQDVPVLILKKAVTRALVGIPDLPRHEDAPVADTCTVKRRPAQRANQLHHNQDVAASSEQEPSE